ncbi:ydhE, partial [Symbiodinium pilosum]
GWNISFPEKKGNNLVAMATVQDLQVAALAVLTLLAWREETVGADGFEHAGQFSLYWNLTSTVLYLLLAAVLICVVLGVLQRFNWHAKLKRLFFRLEEVLLPKRPHQVRQPVLKAAW